MKKKRVVIGMSGGVDSSVSALLLKQQGYEVIGLFMKNWNETSEDGACTAEADYADVKRVSQLLDIPYYTVDLSKEYNDKVFQLFLSEYKKGRTPNPDVLCNREIKFGHFKDYAMKLDADYIATGHYAGIKIKNERVHLRRALDENKDQTYFLNQCSEKQLTNVLFPLQDIDKHEVRHIATKYNLSTANKKDSTGICFIGERDFRKFLSEYIPMKKGKICTLDGNVVGEHNGAFYYTIGQRKGFGIGGGGNGEPYFVIRKDIENNILYVSQGEPPELFSNQLIAEDFNFITGKIENESDVLVRIRHRQPLVGAKLFYDNDNVKIEFKQPVRAVASGQYVVVYENIEEHGKGICFGGGIIK